MKKNKPYLLLSVLLGLLTSPLVWFPGVLVADFWMEPGMGHVGGYAYGLFITGIANWVFYSCVYLAAFIWWEQHKKRSMAQ